MNYHKINAHTVSSQGMTILTSFCYHKPVIELEHLSFAWAKGGRAGKAAPVILDIPNLTINKQEHIFIKGPSGSGKSTLLNLIAGIITPQQGTVTVADTVISKLRGSRRDRFRADSIGFIFQIFNLVPYLSVLENISLPLMFSPQRRQKIDDVEEEVSRLLARLELPKDILATKVTELSIGQQQRVAAARAIIGSPPLLIADEPTSALDADTREAFISLLFEECQRSQMTLLFVSHDGSLEKLFARSLDLNQINKAGIPA